MAGLLPGGRPVSKSFVKIIFLVNNMFHTIHILCSLHINPYVYKCALIFFINAEEICYNSFNVPALNVPY